MDGPSKALARYRAITVNARPSSASSVATPCTCGPVPWSGAEREGPLGPEPATDSVLGITPERRSAATTAPVTPRPTTVMPATTSRTPSVQLTARSAFDDPGLRLDHPRPT